MKYLIDTNVIIEGLLEQEKVDQVWELFQKISLSQMAITDFSLHSIGVILFRLKKMELFISFFEDIIIDGIMVLSLDISDLKELYKIAQRFKLDFDDAYQYAMAEKYNLQIVSFDKDFDGTERGKKEPSGVLL
ncbi:MAG: type II toxin-antitoxin system VapC family toxin [Candidatus Marinimicrobia bacterium]|nr:type II toxin-antitoxin system VapC family toxin [Candidatus Neomarinimicrobiota bacterium]